MALDSNSITTIDKLLTAINSSVGTPQQPPLIGADLNVILRKIVHFTEPVSVAIAVPQGKETPIVINFTDNTIRFGAAQPEQLFDVNALAVDLSLYRISPTIDFKAIIDGENAKPVGGFWWITNEQYTDNTHSSLVAATLQPDTDTGAPGGLTSYDLHILISNYGAGGNGNSNGGFGYLEPDANGNVIIIN